MWTQWWVPRLQITSAILAEGWTQIFPLPLEHLSNILSQELFLVATLPHGTWRHLGNGAAVLGERLEWACAPHCCLLPWPALMLWSQTHKPLFKLCLCFIPYFLCWFPCARCWLFCADRRALFTEILLIQHYQGQQSWANLVALSKNVTVTMAGELALPGVFQEGWVGLDWIDHTPDFPCWLSRGMSFYTHGVHEPKQHLVSSLCWYINFPFVAAHTWPVSMWLCPGVKWYLKLQVFPQRVVKQGS